MSSLCFLISHNREPIAATQDQVGSVHLCMTLLQNFFSSNLQELPDSLTPGEPEIDDNLIEDNVRNIQIEIHQFQQNKWINSVQ